MKLFDFTVNQFEETDIFPEDWCEKDEFFALCSAKEIRTMQDSLYFDESTIIECVNLDERVRYTSFHDYDFISLVYFERLKNSISQTEINIYISKQYIVMVMPDQKNKKMEELEQKILNLVFDLRSKEDRMIKIYYAVFNKMLEDFSDFLENLEDDLQLLQSEILTNVKKDQFESIDNFGQITYLVKKQLRALSFIGAQILLNENDLIPEDHLRYFRSIDTRLKKLYGFGEGLYEHVNQLISSYDSRFSMKTNETVNKLTILTVFFGPLTVITGIYGMNFELMPELRWHYGYPAVLCLMVCISMILYAVLKYKKWM